MQKLTKKPGLVDRSTPFLLQDIAKPHTAKITLAKLQDLKLEVIHHPPYSSDLGPVVYHFFQNLDNIFIRNKFNSDDGIKRSFKDFIESRLPGVYSSTKQAIGEMAKVY